MLKLTIIILMEQVLNIIRHHKGRDTYIGFDNGGLTLHNRNAIQPPVGAFRPKRQP